MTILLYILLSLAGLIALLLIIALLVKKSYHIQREIIVNVPSQKAFDYVKYLKNWDNFNEWAMAEPDKKIEFRGTDGTAGFIYAWNGKKAGEGEKEILSITDGKRIDTEIRFVRPFVAVGRSSMTTEPVSGNQTKVTCSNASTLKYPLNILIPMVEKGLVKDMDRSLSALKGILEK